jgi:hypothetical protein
VSGDARIAQKAGSLARGKKTRQADSTTLMALSEKSEEEDIEEAWSAAEGDAPAAATAAAAGQRGRRNARSDRGGASGRGGGRGQGRGNRDQVKNKRSISNTSHVGETDTLSETWQIYGRNEKALKAKADLIRLNNLDAANTYDLLPPAVRDMAIASHVFPDDTALEGEHDFIDELDGIYDNELREKARRECGNNAVLLAGKDILSINKTEEIMAAHKMGVNGERGRSGAALDASSTATSIGQLIDRKTFGVQTVLVAGFATEYDREAVMMECAHLAGANEICFDMPKLKARLDSMSTGGAWKVFESPENNHFAVAVPLTNVSIFRCTPKTGELRDHPLVMQRSGKLHSYANGKAYSNVYTITPLIKGTQWFTNPNLYNAEVAAVFRVVAQYEAELGLFQLMLTGWLSTLEGLVLTPHSYTVIPMPIGFKTDRYLHGDHTRNWMREVVFLVVVHGADGQKARMDKIRTELHLWDDKGLLTTRQKMLGCFHTVVVPNLQTIKNCVAMDPLSNVFDYMGQITITGMIKNLAGYTLMNKFWGSGIINPRGVTGACISRGNGKAMPHTNEILTEDALHLMGTSLIKVNINPGAHTFEEIALSNTSLRVNTKVGQAYRASKRQEHGNALAAWRAARQAHAGGGIVMFGAEERFEVGAMANSAINEQVSMLVARELQPQLAELKRLGDALREASAQAADNEAARRLREEERDALAESNEKERRQREESERADRTTRREEKEKARQEEAARRSEAELVESAARAEREGKLLRLDEERQLNDEARHDRERLEDLAREETLNIATALQRETQHQQLVAQQATADRDAGERHREIMAKAAEEAERDKKSESLTATLLSLLLSNQAAAATTAEALACLMRDRNVTPSEAAGGGVVATEDKGSRKTRDKAPVGKEGN